MRLLRICAVLALLSGAPAAAQDRPAPTNPAEALARGRAYYGDGKFQLAAAQLEPLRSGRRPEVLYLLVECYQRLGDNRKALDAFGELLQNYPDSAFTHKLMGTAYDAQGRLKEALAEFEHAARIDPRLARVRFGAGLVCLKLHDDKAARKWFQEEVAVNPCYAPAHYYLGEIERRGANLPAAVRSYRQAVRCAPRYAEAYVGLAISLREQDNNSDAVRLLRRAAELAPEQADVHIQLARSLAKAGLHEEAGRELATAKRLQAAREAKERADLERKAGK